MSGEDKNWEYHLKIPVSNDSVGAVIFFILLFYMYITLNFVMILLITLKCMEFERCELKFSRFRYLIKRGQQ